MGGRVMLSGPCQRSGRAPTTSMRADAGVVISASHNPFGTTASRSSRRRLQAARPGEMEIESLIAAPTRPQAPTRAPVGPPTARRRPGRYVAFVKQTFPQDLSLEGLRIV